MTLHEGADSDDPDQLRNHGGVADEDDHDSELESDNAPDADNDDDDDDDDDKNGRDDENRSDVGNEDEDLVEGIEDEDEEDEEELDEQDVADSQDKEMLGGTIALDAFALLTGVFFEDPEDFTQKQVLSIPITRLPATLGRSHDTKDKNFFGLGTRKVLSRSQAVIFWRDRLGGRIVQNGSSDKLIYQPPPKGGVKEVIRPNQHELLPEMGFYAIECLGKNRIFVDGQRLDQGDVALLESGSSIKMNSYSLLFLLPEDATQKVMAVPLPGQKAKSAPSASAGGGNAGGSKAGSVLAEHLDKASTQQLLQWFFDAIENNQWERRHQMIGGAITLHACLDAARSKKIQRLAKAENGVSRSEVMDWIKDSKRYSEWVKHVMNKMELKSYQANVTKCLWKAGYRRNAPVGRFVRWNLPSLEELGVPEPSGADEEEDDDSDEERDDTKDEPPENDEEEDDEDDEAGEAEDDGSEEEDSKGEERKHDDEVEEEDSHDGSSDVGIESSLQKDSGVEEDEASGTHDQEIDRLHDDKGSHVAAKRMRMSEAEDE